MLTESFRFDGKFPLRDQFRVRRPVAGSGHVAGSAGVRIGKRATLESRRWLCKAPIFRKRLGTATWWAVNYTDPNGQENTPHGGTVSLETDSVPIGGIVSHTVV